MGVQHKRLRTSIRENRRCPLNGVESIVLLHALRSAMHDAVIHPQPVAVGGAHRRPVLREDLKIVRGLAPLPSTPFGQRSALRQRVAPRSREEYVVLATCPRSGEIRRYLVRSRNLHKYYVLKEWAGKWMMKA